MDAQYDVIVLGTGLTESIAAAALSKAGLKVIHIDRQPYYGGTEASLTTDELHRWVEALSAQRSAGKIFSSASTSGDLPSTSRSYSLSLAPSVIVSKGPLISSLIASGVARYGGFKLLDQLLIYSDARFKSVPGSKEDIFKSKEISLVDKRRLMRFLVFAAGDFENSPELQGKQHTPFRLFLKETFSLNEELSVAITFALALCSSNVESTIGALNRIKTHLRSAGRYGPSPFLVGHYGGLGELAQGYCRICAVSGGTYILGREVSTISRVTHTDNEPAYRLSIEDIDESIKGKLIIASSDYLSVLEQLNLPQIPGSELGDETAYCIAIVTGPLLTPSTSRSSDTDNTTHDNETESHLLDTALLVFPPDSLSSAKASESVHVLINGEGTLSCPKGECILYLTTPSGASQNPDELLRPYLDATVSLLRTSSGSQPTVQYSAFYKKSGAQVAGNDAQADRRKEHSILLCSPPTSRIAMNGDEAASEAERIFHSAMELLGKADAEGLDSMWPPLPLDQDDDD